MGSPNLAATVTVASNVYQVGIEDAKHVCDFLCQPRNWSTILMADSVLLAFVDSQRKEMVVETNKGPLQASALYDIRGKN